MRTKPVARALAPALLAAYALHAETLYEKDGVTLEGSVRMVHHDAATCQVIAENESPEAYERTKANHGRRLHVWRLDYSALNGSGQSLSQLTAHFRIDSEWPPCTSWTGPNRSYSRPLQWAGSFETLQRAGGMEPGEEARDTLYVLSIDGQQPRFANWQVNYRFATDDGPASAGNPDAAPRATGESAASASLPRPEPTCDGKPEGAHCWKELASHPGCYFWDDNNIPEAPRTWTGGCSGGLADGSGKLEFESTPGPFDSEGLMRNGKREGLWVDDDGGWYSAKGPYVDGEKNGGWLERFANGAVQEGSYVDGERHGHWVMRLSTGSVHQGPYVNGKRRGHWVRRQKSGTIIEGPYVDDKMHGLWLTRHPSGRVHKRRWVRGKAQD